MRINIKKLKVNQSIFISAIIYSSLMARIFMTTDTSTTRVIITAAIIAITTLLITRETAQYSLYGTSTPLPMSIALIALSLLIEPSQALQCSISALFITLSFSSFNKAIQEYNNTTSKIFAAAIWSGMAAVATPPAIVLIIPSLLSILFFERIKREYFATAIGFLIPTIATIYYQWLTSTEPINIIINNYILNITTHNNTTLKWDIPIVWVIALAILFAMLSSAMLSKLSIKSISRSRINNNTMWIITGALILAIPSFSISNYTLFTASIAITTTALLFELKHILSTIIYIAIAITAIAYNLSYLFEN